MPYTFPKKQKRKRKKKKQLEAIPERSNFVGSKKRKLEEEKNRCDGRPLLIPLMNENLEKTVRLGTRLYPQKKEKISKFS